MDYIKGRTYIDESHRFGGERGLEAITCLLEKLGNPQETLQLIHIAGTNGKGSVGAYLAAAVLQEAGYRIGRFISPTLYEYREKDPDQRSIYRRRSLRATDGSRGESYRGTGRRT